MTTDLNVIIEIRPEDAWAVGLKEEEVRNNDVILYGSRVESDKEDGFFFHPVRLWLNNSIIKEYPKGAKLMKHVSED